MREIEFNEPFYTSLPSYNRLAKLHSEIASSTEENLMLKLNIEKRTGLTFAFCLGVLPLVAKSLGKDLDIIANEKLVRLMNKIGIIDNVQNNSSPKTGNIATLLKESARIIETPDDIFDLVTEITKEAPVKMNEKLEEIFTSKVGEMYNNSLEHSDALYVTGGKYYKYQKNLYCFSCYDTGVGIPRRVSNFLSQKYNKHVTQREAFQWALKKGNSTVQNSIPRGLGMELLSSFAKLNGGAIRICSGNILYTNDSNGENYTEISDGFIGTLFEMDIVADNKRTYILK